MGKVEFTTKYDLHSFDAAVFCLSIMAEDALGKSLLLCSKLVKAKGAIMVIIPVQKLLGIMPGNKQTETYTRPAPGTGSTTSRPCLVALGSASSR